MSLQFSLTDGTPLTITPGFPENYSGAKLKGAVASHVLASFGHLVIQEFHTRQMRICRMLIHWDQPARIKCEYNYFNPVLFARAMDDKSMCEVLKGAGDVYLKKNEFSVHTGSKWSGLLMSEKPGDHDFTNFIWNADYVGSVLSDDAYYAKISRHFGYELPERVTTTGRTLDGEMNFIIDQLVELDLADAKSKLTFEELMIRQLKLMFRELKECESIRRK